MYICRIVPVLLCSYYFHSFLRISVWIFKKAQLELLFESMGCRLGQSLVGKSHLLYCIAFRNLMSLSGIIAFFSSSVGFLCSLDIIRAADNIYSSMNGQSHPFADFQLFHAPGHVLNNSGITVDIAPKSHLLLQKFLDKIIVKGKSHWFPFNRISLKVILICALLSGRFRIVRHDRSGIFLNGCLKRRNVVSLQAVFCLINIPLSLTIMRVKAILPGASSREVFHRHSHAIWGQAFLASLYSGDQPLKNLFDQLGILSESTVSSLPSGVCGTVRHIHISFFHTNCVPFSPDTVSKIINNMEPVSFYCSGDPHGSRPGGKYTGGIIHAKDYLAVLISGVRYHHDRNKMFPFFCQAVHLIDPVCQLIWPWIAS